MERNIKVEYYRAGLNDVEAIVLMQNQLTDMLNLNHDPEEEILNEYIKEEIESQEAAYFIAKVNETTIGVVLVDFSNLIYVDNIEFVASIPFIFVDEKYRRGAVAYDLFNLALKEVKQKDKNSLVMSVEDNNPYKFLHFAIADILIEENEALTEDGKTKQYILGITDVGKVQQCSFKNFIRNIVNTKKNFSQVLKDFPRAETIEYSL